MKRRHLLAALIFLAILLVVSAAVLAQNLRPCAPLDVTLGRSGCQQVIRLPGATSALSVSVSSAGDRAAVVAETGDPALQVLILDAGTWQVISQVSVQDTPAAGPEAEAVYPRFVDGSTDLLRGYFGRMGFADGGASTPDGARRAAANRDGLTLEVTQGGERLSVISLPSAISRPHMMFSHDGQRLIVPLGYAHLTAWAVETGEQLFELKDVRISDYDWMPDNRTIVIVWNDGEGAALALFQTP